MLSPFELKKILRKASGGDILILMRDSHEPKIRTNVCRVSVYITAFNPPITV